MNGTGRQDILLAEQEFFAGGGESGAMPVIAPAQYRYAPVSAVTATYGYAAVWRGEPIALALSDCPALILAMPASREHRTAMQMKFIEYSCDVRFAWPAQGNPQTLSVAADAYWTFCGFLDAIASVIRGGPGNSSAAKQLITPSYPTGGAVIRWGEDFTIQESRDPLETSVLLLARFSISATEQVVA